MLTDNRCFPFVLLDMPLPIPLNGTLSIQSGCYFPFLPSRYIRLCLNMLFPIIYKRCPVIGGLVCLSKLSLNEAPLNLGNGIGITDFPLFRYAV